MDFLLPLLLGIVSVALIVVTSLWAVSRAQTRLDKGALIGALVAALLLLPSQLYELWMKRRDKN